MTPQIMPKLGTAFLLQAECGRVRDPVRTLAEMNGGSRLTLEKFEENFTLGKIRRWLPSTIVKEKIRRRPLPYYIVQAKLDGGSRLL